MKLGTEVGLGPGHIVLDRDPASCPQKGHSHPNLPESVAAKWLDWLRCHFVVGTEVGLGPGDFV